MEDHDLVHHQGFTHPGDLEAAQEALAERLIQFGRPAASHRDQPASFRTYNFLVPQEILGLIRDRKTVEGSRPLLEERLGDMAASPPHLEMVLHQSQVEVRQANKARRDRVPLGDGSVGK